MSDRFSDRDATREALSALADGNAQAPEVARACAAWRDQPDARATWQAYQMIGDVMRSEDLAEASPGDAFLQRFRERLAQEPVVLAPIAANAAANAQHAASQAAQAAYKAAAGAAPAAVPPALKRRVWAGPMAVAAGFVAVVGVLLTSQMLPGGGASGGDASLAQAGAIMGAPSVDLSLALAPAGVAAGANTVADAGRLPGVSIPGASFNRPGEVVLVRDPQLDQALALHRAVSSGDASFSGQGGLVRQVAFDGR